MKVVAAYLLAVLGGNDHPTAKDIKNILKSVGADADEQTITKLIDELADKSVFDVMEKGRSKLASVPSGGAVAVSGGAAPSASAVETKETPKEDDKKKKKEESSESEEDAGFGNDAFSKTLANFTSIADNEKDLFITNILHKAYVQVDEKGTEAAAASTAVIKLKKRRITSSKSFVADRPFIFIIQHIPTKSIVFSGTVMDPKF
jgi:large subunit ribosomal protein LP2